MNGEIGLTLPIWSYKLFKKNIQKNWTGLDLMPLYNQQLLLPAWKPIFFDHFIAEIWKEFGTSKPIKVINDNFTQYIFYDASIFNSDQLIIVVTFIKNDNKTNLSFIAGNEIVKWFDWDLSTESNVVSRYRDKFISLLKIMNKNG